MKTPPTKLFPSVVFAGALAGSLAGCMSQSFEGEGEKTGFNGVIAYFNFLDDDRVVFKASAVVTLDDTDAVPELDEVPVTSRGSDEPLATLTVRVRDVGSTQTIIEFNDVSDMGGAEELRSLPDGSAIPHCHGFADHASIVALEVDPRPRRGFFARMFGGGDDERPSLLSHVYLAKNDAGVVTGFGYALSVGREKALASGLPENRLEDFSYNVGHTKNGCFGTYLTADDGGVAVFSNRNMGQFLLSPGFY